METKFYEISQNNSGGSFVVDDKLCHRLIIEAYSSDEANEIAESLGCYWDGVESGDDCPCCGDRWYGSHEINIQDQNKKWNGFEVSKWIKSEDDVDQVIKEMISLYPGATWLSELKVDGDSFSKKISGRVKLNNIEQYAQLMANQYGWTTPDYRIFYKDGTVKEIFLN